MLWSLISPSCLILIKSILNVLQISWTPGDPNFGQSIIIYLVYWGFLGSLQGALLYKLQYKTLAYKWFLTTSITGFLIMSVHDVALLGTDTRGQGVLILIFSLPILIALGGLVLGCAQFLLLDNRHGASANRSRILSTWCVASFISWSLGFVGIFLSFYIPIPEFPIILLTTVGGAIKGWSVIQYLRR